MTQHPSRRLSSLAFHLAQPLRESGISVYAYHPGILQSELMKGMPALVRYLTFPFGRTAGPALAAARRNAPQRHP